MSNAPDEYQAPDRGEQVLSETPASDFPGKESTLVPFPDPDFSDMQPVPVYDVTPDADPEQVLFSATSMTITSEAVEIAGAKPSRKRLVILNTGPDSVTIGPDQGISAVFGFILPINQSITLENNARVFARCAATKTAGLSIIQEYGLNVDRSAPATQ